MVFQNILFLKEFLACNGCFRLFTKIKKGSGTSFQCTFFCILFHKNVLYLILYQWIKFQCHTFLPSQNIKQNILLSSYLDSWRRHKLLRFIFDQPLKQWLQWDLNPQPWLTGGKRGEDGNAKNWISWERKDLLRWNKKHFS